MNDFLQVCFPFMPMKRTGRFSIRFYLIHFSLQQFIIFQFDPRDVLNRIEPQAISAFQRDTIVKMR